MGIKKLGVMFLDGKIALPSMLEPMKFTMNESLLGAQIAVYYETPYGIAAIGGGRTRTMNWYWREMIWIMTNLFMQRSPVSTAALPMWIGPAWTASSLNRRCRPHEEV